ncbi:YjdF family protein [Tissierellaceae bacterium HCP3S3_D8]
MNKVASTLTVYFDGQFWIGIYERISEGRLEVSKITFGAEPKDYEVYGFILKNWKDLKFSPRIEDNAKENRKINPKKMQREINKQLKNKGVGTKSQQALKLQQEQNKLDRKSLRKMKKEEEKRIQFELRQKKKKAKHRGK